jgi:citrate/tricarballylate utilization protein
MHATESLAEADRLMTVCNSCRYCEGLCAVFPAMEMRRAFPDGDLNYLANLCHACGACYYDCQFSPPHEFNVNVPRTLAKVRARSYAAYAWPACFSSLFSRNGRAVSLIAFFSVSFFVAALAAVNSSIFLVRHKGPGAFYALMSHGAMILLFGLSFLFAVTALVIGVGKFWRDIGEPAETFAAPDLIREAAGDALRLRYLDGGGVGCMNEGERPTDRRALWHHLTFYGFSLCFAATVLATLYHYLLGREAPYPWWDLPVLLGTAGGFCLVAGPAGLLLAKFRRDPELGEGENHGMDVAFTAMLFLTGLTGLALLLLRATPALGPLLALHLGIVFALFVTMPYGKFVHGIYRFAALVRYARERRSLSLAADTAES